MSSANLAISVCTDAWTQAHQEVMQSNRGRLAADNAGAAAYRRALPTLADAEKILDFVACVAHGIAIGAIEPSVASRLLYAAQVAKSATRPPAGTVIKQP